MQGLSEKPDQHAPQSYGGPSRGLQGALKQTSDPGQGDGDGRGGTRELGRDGVHPNDG